MPARTVFESVGVSTGFRTRAHQSPARVVRADVIEEAMVAAARQAQSEGITDPQIIRARIAAARDRARG